MNGPIDMRAGLWFWYCLFEFPRKEEGSKCIFLKRRYGAIFDLVHFFSGLSFFPWQEGENIGVTFLPFWHFPSLFQNRIFSRQNARRCTQPHTEPHAIPLHCKIGLRRFESLMCHLLILSGAEKALSVSLKRVVFLVKGTWRKKVNKSKEALS